ncbi:S-layer homology domain-containing protein [Egicoccus halophilus]|uniref:SLH domain-containing protein n=1 Tax=Egicoccus halophilus TaxID=1670830 RepID=A0A8J3AA94_9ACTN|nr:S-layer homology domain-containing protein [Egicoccus halophilus]GGI05955.1 hypothetical protein GCM10011354_16690 [Egicoccus halophilus]
MSKPHRSARALGAGLAGAMVLSLLPAGAALARPDVDTVCDDAPVFDFQDANVIAPNQAQVVNCLAAYGITVGDTDGNFLPGTSTTRQQMALFVARFLSQAVYGTNALPPEAYLLEDAFPDVAVLRSAQQRAAINWLADLGIVSGFTDETYRPAARVSRQQMATYVAESLRALDVDLPTGVNRFPDVVPGAAHAANVTALREVEIVTGFRDGNFRPGQNVSRQQVARYLVNAAAYTFEQDPEAWAGQYLGTPPTLLPIPPAPSAPPAEPVTYSVDVAEVLVPTPAQVAFTAEVSGAQQVAIALLDADAVEVDEDGVLTDVGDGSLAAAASAVVINVNGRSISGGINPAVADVDGPVHFTVGTMDEESFVALVFDPPSVSIEDGALVGSYGVSDVVTVTNVEGIALTDEDGAPVAATSVPADTEVTVNAGLVDVEGELVPTGGQLEYELARVDGVERCDALQADPGAADEDEVFLRGATTLTDGAAQVVVPGGAGGDVHCVLARWDPTDGPYERSSATSGLELAGHGAIAYRGAPIATTARFASDTTFVPAGSWFFHALTVRDQYDAPVAGADVRFVATSGSNTVAETRTTTAADGVAVLRRHGSDNRTDVVSAVVERPGGDSLPAVTAIVHWYDQSTDLTDATYAYLGFDGAADRLFVRPTGAAAFPNYGVSYAEVDIHRIDGETVSFEQFEAALGTATVTDVSITGLYTAEASTVFDLRLAED